MANFPLELPFVLQSMVNSQMVIQAAADGGGGLSLQPFDQSFKTKTQQFVLRMQNNLDSNGVVIASGPAFINLGSTTGNLNNSVTAQGANEPLLMESWSPSSQDRDAWSLAPVEGSVEAIRIVQSENPGWSWNDQGGGGGKGDPIYLWNDTNVNSAWSVIFVPADKITDPLPKEQPFLLLSTVNSGNGIQANPGPGQGLSLQPVDMKSLAQQFVLRMQNNINNFTEETITTCGISFVNLGSTAAPSVYNSVIGQGEDVVNNGQELSRPVLVQPWVPGSLAEDAMYPQFTSGGIRIFQAPNSQAQSANLTFSWNDWGGQGATGDGIYLFNDQASNSIWTVNLLDS